MQGYTAELAVSAIISSWCRGDAEQNRQAVAGFPMAEKITAETLLGNQVEQPGDGIGNPFHRLDFSSLQGVAINRLVAHFLFGKPLDYDDMRESTKITPDSAIRATRASKPSALTRVRDNIPESGGGMASSLWGVV